MVTFSIAKIKSIAKEFTPKFQQNLFLLFISSQIRNVAINLLGAFGVIFFFQKFENSIIYLLIYFFLSSLPYVFWAPLNGMIVCKLGLKKSIIIGTILFVFVNMSYLLFDLSLAWGIVASLALTVISRSFYWIPYHIYFASFTNKENRGYQISVIKDVMIIFNIFIPILASLLIIKFGFDIIFILSMVLHAISIIPLLKIDDIKLDYSFKYFESFKRIFSKEFRHDSFLFFLEGAEGVSSVILWPVAMFLILKGDFAKLGFLTALVIAGTIITNILVGKMSDKKDKRKIIRFGAIFYSFGWILKMFSFNGIQIFLSSLYHNFADSIMRVPYDNYWYEEDSKKGEFIDEYITLREMAIHAGRSFMLVITILAIKYLGFTINNTFIFGAVCFLFLGLFIKKEIKLMDEE